MGDFDTDQLSTDWQGVLERGGSLSFTFAGAAVSGIWAARFSQLEDFEEQLRNERRFTIFTTFAEVSTTPAVKMTLARGGVTYFIEAVRNDAENIGIELDVKQVL